MNFLLVYRHDNHYPTLSAGGFVHGQLRDGRYFSFVNADDTLADDPPRSLLPLLRIMDEERVKTTRRQILSVALGTRNRRR